MALLEILKFPNPRLRIKAKPVTHIDAEFRRKVDDMYQTMYETQGVGLAGTQVDFHYRVFTMDVSDSHSQPYCIINPEIISQSGLQYEAEGCLSVGGGAFDKVERSLHVKVSGMDIDGKLFELDANELMAACIQHEIDHLNGILFIDHLSRLKQERIRKKITKSRE